MKKILVVGQTPPPYGGQAVMIQHLVEHQFPNIKIYHVRMAFSRGMKDMGKLQVYKVMHLLNIVIKIYYYRICRQVDILYYPPSGPNSAVYRDMMILFPTRWMFKKTIFHFHASGLSEHLKRKNKLFRFIFKRCFFYPDVAIRLSESCPDEGKAIQAKKRVIVPNGLPDEAVVKNEQKQMNRLNILFIGLLEESKGELDLCKAVKILKERGIECHAKIAGEFKSAEYRRRFFEFISENDLVKNIEYIGVIRGQKKQDAFRNSDVFCFPSYFHSESFPLVLIEAMSYGLPIVATRWRGIVDMVNDGYNGYLVEPKSPEKVADRLQLLFENIELRKQIAERSRSEFEKRYEMGQHLKMMEDLFNNI